MTLSKRRFITLWTTIVLVGFTLVGCSGVCSGSVETGFSHFPKNNISPEEAIKLASSYLDYSFELREKERAKKRNVIHPEMPDTVKREIMVILEGNYYYITKDYYNYKTIQGYMWDAVRVNRNTGEVIPPRIKEDLE